MHILLSVLLPGLQLAHATSIYLSPPSISTSNLSPQDASFTLSRHFGLEFFEPQPEGSYGEEPFVGQGMTDALLLTSREEDAKAILPDSIHPSLTLDNALDGNAWPILTTYVHRAKLSYSSVFAGLDYSPEDLPHSFIQSIHSLSNYLATSQRPAFAALDLSPLAQIQAKFGPQSEEYTTSLEAARLFVQDALASSESLRFALLAYPSVSNEKRAASPQQTQSPFPDDRPAPPQKPIGSVSTCFTTADACINGTSSCSGRGRCVEASKAGRSCYVCTCEVTKTGSGAQTKTEVWAGESCEKEDISGPFVLLTGTVITIILLIAGSVGLLSGVGSQELPGVLMGGVVGGKRD